MYKTHTHTCTTYMCDECLHCDTCTPRKPVRRTCTVHAVQYIYSVNTALLFACLLTHSLTYCLNKKANVIVSNFVSLLPTIAGRGIVFSSLLSGCLAVRLSVVRRSTCILCDATSLWRDFNETWHKHSSYDLNCWEGFQGQRSKVKVICVQLCECYNGVVASRLTFSLSHQGRRQESAQGVFLLFFPLLSPLLSFFLPSPPLSLASLPIPLHPPFSVPALPLPLPPLLSRPLPSLPLEVGPLNQLGSLGSVVSSPQRGPG